MSRIVYDSWERLVEAVLKREELRRIALSESFSSSASAESSSHFSFDFFREDVPYASSRGSNFSFGDVQPIEFKEIIKATKNFRPDLLIGSGILCQVYKAWIDADTLTASKRGSGMAVAVKKWNPIDLERHQEWIKEIDHLNELRHPNLVELVGYCSEEDNMILVYEFMEKGSLYNHLFIGHQSLPWATRIRVAIDAARGLSFLHEKNTPIIHRDFKTANILLDGDFNAKLSNYCFGRDDPIGDMTYVSTDQVVITYGYIAPEYEETGHLTTKFNVYTFGVVLLELLNGLPAYDINRPTKERYLLERVKPYLGDKPLLQIVDNRLEGQCPHKEGYKVAELASQCLSSLPEERPRMAEVLIALEQL